MRTVGVEEELLLVDVETGRPRSVAAQVIQASEREASASGRDVSEEVGGKLEQELQQQQVETDSHPQERMADLEDDLREGRRRTASLARDAGARLIAAGTSPMKVDPHLVDSTRYYEMADRFGLTTTEQLTCGLHIHVSVESDEEAVGILDRIRTWLPTLLALSANSPFWQGEDTGYASYRLQVLYRWPTAGPTDVYGSAEAYHAMLRALVDSGVALDEGMFYRDARLSHHYPTIEIRIADVCADVRDTVLLAALGRALVVTAAREWQEGRPPPDVPVTLLRAATWQASREGSDARIIDPATGHPESAGRVVDQLVGHVGEALHESGDGDLVSDRAQAVLTRGNGARRQREVLEKTGSINDVVADLARVTLGQHE